jgi:hypothetical protein
MEDLGSSLLQRASFERTLPVLEDAALFAKSDILGGATEKQIVGLPVHVGTGVVDALPSLATTSPVYVAPLDRANNRVKLGQQSGSVIQENSVYVAPLRGFPRSDPRSDSSMAASAEDTYVEPLHTRFRREALAETFVSPLEPQCQQNQNLSWNPRARTSFQRSLQRPSLREFVANVVTCWKSAAAGCLLRTRLTQVSKSTFVGIEKRLREFHGWDEWPLDGDWSRVCDVSYDIDGLGEVHTLVEHKEDGSIARWHVQKSIVQTFCELSSDLDLALSASLMHERDVQLETLPPSIVPKAVRIKLRLVFVQRGWAYILCKWWDGRTLLEAEEAQRSQDSCFDVRIELWDPMSTGSADTESICKDLEERWSSLVSES